MCTGKNGVVFSRWPLMQHITSPEKKGRTSDSGKSRRTELKVSKALKYALYKCKKYASEGHFYQPPLCKAN